MQTYVSPSSEVSLGSVPASPSCPTCKLEMRFVQVTSITFTPDLVDVSYICDECGRGTKRTLKENPLDKFPWKEPRTLRESRR